MNTNLAGGSTRRSMASIQALSLTIIIVNQSALPLYFCKAKEHNVRATTSKLFLVTQYLAHPIK